MSAYQAGVSAPKLAEQYGVSRVAIQQLLHDQGVTLRRRPLSEGQLQRVRDLHEAGLSTYAIARRGGHSAVGRVEGSTSYECKRDL